MTQNIRARSNNNNLPLFIQDDWNQRSYANTIKNLQAKSEYINKLKTKAAVSPPVRFAYTKLSANEKHPLLMSFS